MKTKNDLPVILSLVSSKEDLCRCIDIYQHLYQPSQGVYAKTFKIYDTNLDWHSSTAQIPHS